MAQNVISPLEAGAAVRARDTHTDVQACGALCENNCELGGAVKPTMDALPAWAAKLKTRPVPERNATSDEDMRTGDASTRVLPPYARGGLRRFRRPLSVALVIYCFFYGIAFAIFAPWLLLPLLVPLLALLAVLIWALPEAKTAPTALVVGLFYCFFVALIIWPNYLAIALPGLPWITMVRLSGFPLVTALLVATSVSGTFRRTLGEALASTPWLWRALVAVVIIQLISIGLSKDMAQSTDRFIVAQLSWTAIFFASTYVFLRPSRVERWAVLLWLLAMVLGGEALLENRIQHVPWANHVPGFLKVNDPSVQRTLAGQTRNDVYRVQATFTTS